VGANSKPANKAFHQLCGFRNTRSKPDQGDCIKVFLTLVCAAGNFGSRTKSATSTDNKIIKPAIKDKALRQPRFSTK
jgi:hypothetical protein